MELSRPSLILSRGMLWRADAISLGRDDQYCSVKNVLYGSPPMGIVQHLEVRLAPSLIGLAHAFFWSRRLASQHQPHLHQQCDPSAQGVLCVIPTADCSCPFDADHATEGTDKNLVCESAHGILSIAH